ncbi:MAG TPA: response regulator transcription factor [Bryobacteraceae bacterium]|nr:response regulator transcription factor [Bryobacteraceae bacterium]
MSLESVNTVAVCDTEPIAIEGLRALLESGDELRVVAAESSLVDGMDAVRALTPSLLLLDKAFGIHAVMDFLKALRDMGNRTAVIVWSFSFSEAEALRFLQAGAAGVVRKTAPLDILMSCIRAVVSGNTWMEEEKVRDADRPVRCGRSPLTSRELQVMELVERGFKNKDIGASLGIRTGTVKIHLKHIFEKTGIRGRYGLALSGLKEKGLLAMTPVEIAS